MRRRRPHRVSPFPQSQHPLASSWRAAKPSARTRRAGSMVLRRVEGVNQIAIAALPARMSNWGIRTHDLRALRVRFAPSTRYPRNSRRNKIAALTGAPIAVVQPCGATPRRSAGAHFPTAAFVNRLIPRTLSSTDWLRAPHSADPIRCDPTIDHVSTAPILPDSRSAVARADSRTHLPSGAGRTGCAPDARAKESPLLGPC